MIAQAIGVTAHARVPGGYADGGQFVHALEESHKNGRWLGGPVLVGLVGRYGLEYKLVFWFFQYSTGAHTADLR